ncbi:unnamed protein product [Trichobilharzia regenti]|nr:unnamed protein product [Trichobilharzia regenti]
MIVQHQRSRRLGVFYPLCRLISRTTSFEASRRKTKIHRIKLEQQFLIATHLNETLYGQKLAVFMEQEKLQNLKVWTSYFKRTIQTADKIKCSQIRYWKALDELDAGVCDGMTYDEIQEKYPDDFARRDANKYHYRYPMGEVGFNYK